MAGDDLNGLIVQEAWERLWSVGTKYHLPAAIVSGAQGNGLIVLPLGELSVADTGDIPLYESDIWGSVSIEVAKALIGGLDTLTNGGMSYDPRSRAFSASMSIGCLTFAGDYIVSAGEMSGRTIDSASTLLKIAARPREAIAGAAAGIADQSDLDLAVSYREQLVGLDNGLDLVSTYYDNNETLDEIVSNDTVFQRAWQLYETAGHNTAYYAQQTATAAASPRDPNATVGDENYRFHAAYMRTTLFSRVMYYQKQGDPDGRYHALATAIIGFKGQTEPYVQPMTAGQVMEQVEKPTPRPRLESIPSEDSVEARAERQAEHDLPMWEEHARAFEAELPDTKDPAVLEGRFESDSKLANITVQGSVDITNIEPNRGPLVSLMSLAAYVPPVAIELPDDSKLLVDAQNAIARSMWFQQLLAKKINSELSASQVLVYLTDRLNQAIMQALGPS